MKANEDVCVHGPARSNTHNIGTTFFSGRSFPLHPFQERSQIHPPSSIPYALSEHRSLLCGKEGYDHLTNYSRSPHPLLATETAE